MNLHKHMYLLEQHSESFKSWSAIIRIIINTQGKSLIMKLGPVHYSCALFRYILTFVTSVVLFYFILFMAIDC